MKRPVFNARLCGPLLLIFVAGCGSRAPEVRTYTEITTGAPEPQKGDETAHAHAAPASTLSWSTPEGWVEKAGSGMRLATFDLTHGEENSECTLIALGPGSGELEPNVRRWLGQLGIREPDETRFSAFLTALPKFTTAGGQSGTLVDYGPLVGPDAEASMLAAIIPFPDRVLFVKLTGSPALIAAAQPAFNHLCTSIR